MYIVRFLHQTTTDPYTQASKGWLYIVRFLHQTTTPGLKNICLLMLYIVRFLHQTTTQRLLNNLLTGCISSVSYIKPQHNGVSVSKSNVVYRPFPTSNHNIPVMVIDKLALYIVRFLHQTTTVIVVGKLFLSCISSVSYIKPQLWMQMTPSGMVVYRPFPTSNHNEISNQLYSVSVVYRPFPTSNHNLY